MSEISAEKKIEKVLLQDIQRAQWEWEELQDRLRCREEELDRLKKELRDLRDRGLTW